MSRRISQKTKIKRRMGQGEGADYIPYITTREFNSLGTTALIKDWVTGRTVHCFSQGEARWYYILRWDDENIDIREQYPLDYDETVRIAEKLGVKRPAGVMTTDFLVTKKDGRLIAYSVKNNSELTERQLQLLCIEKTYWINKNVEYKILFKEDANDKLATNIRMVTEYYDPNNVHDLYSAIKHKIATKRYKVDMENKILEADGLKQLLEVNDECNN